MTLGPSRYLWLSQLGCGVFSRHLESRGQGCRWVAHNACPEKELSCPKCQQCWETQMHGNLWEVTRSFVECGLGQQEAMEAIGEPRKGTRGGWRIRRQKIPALPGVILPERESTQNPRSRRSQAQDQHGSLPWWRVTLRVLTLQAGSSSLLSVNFTPKWHVSLLP